MFLRALLDRQNKVDTGSEWCAGKDFRRSCYGIFENILLVSIWSSSKGLSEEVILWLRMRSTIASIEVQNIAGTSISLPPNLISKYWNTFWSPQHFFQFLLLCKVRSNHVLLVFIITPTAAPLTWLISLPCRYESISQYAYYKGWQLSSRTDAITAILLKSYVGHERDKLERTFIHMICEFQLVWVKQRRITFVFVIP